MFCFSKYQMVYNLMNQVICIGVNNTFSYIRTITTLSFFEGYKNLFELTHFKITFRKRNS
jgi:hypothetical protein